MPAFWYIAIAFVAATMIYAAFGPRRGRWIFISVVLGVGAVLFVPLPCARAPMVACNNVTDCAVTGDRCRSLLGLSEPLHSSTNSALASLALAVGVVAVAILGGALITSKRAPRAD